MNKRIKRILNGVLMTAGLLVASQSHAAMVAYENVGFIKGGEGYSDSFHIDSAGTYQAMLTDFVFPNSFSQLGLDVTTADTSMGRVDLTSQSNQDSFIFAATPGTYYANVFGVAGSPLDLGLFGVKIESFTVPPVPVPAAIILLASGLCVLVQMAWRRREAAGHDNLVTKESYSSAMV